MMSVWIFYYYFSIHSTSHLNPFNWIADGLELVAAMFNENHSNAVRFIQKKQQKLTRFRFHNNNQTRLPQHFDKVSWLMEAFVFDFLFFILNSSCNKYSHLKYQVILILFRAMNLTLSKCCWRISLVKLAQWNGWCAAVYNYVIVWIALSFSAGGPFHHIHWFPADSLMEGSLWKLMAVAADEPGWVFLIELKHKILLLCSSAAVPCFGVPTNVSLNK